MNHLKGNESMRKLREIIKNNEIFNGISTVGKGRNKQTIIQEINDKIDQFNADNKKVA